MARIKGPNDCAEMQKHLSDFLSHENNCTNLASGWKVMRQIEATSTKNGFCSDKDLQAYLGAYLVANMSLLHGKKYETQVLLFHKAVNFIKTMNKVGNGSGLLSMYSFYVKALINLGKKDAAKVALLEYKKQFDQTDVDLFAVNDQLRARYMLYSVYYAYYKHPMSVNGSKMIKNAVGQMKAGLKWDFYTSDAFLLKICEVTIEAIKVRAFRQSNYLLRAFKIFQKANKNDLYKNFTDDQTKYGDSPSLQCIFQLCYAKHMLKMLTTMKERSMAEEKLSQGILLSKNEKSYFKVIEDCHTFDDIEVSEEDEILDGLLKNEKEIKWVYRQIQKKMKAIKASYHKKIKDDRDQCLAELKDVEQFFKITK